MKAPERFVTARLVLRRPREADAEMIFSRYASDPEVTRLLAWPTHTSVEATRAFITVSDHHWQKWPAGPFLIVSRTTNELLGSTGLTFHAEDRVETGYLLTKASWGQGYASEALSAMLDLSAALGLHAVQAHCHISHAASARVLEKCGFIRHATVPDYAILPNLDAQKPSDVFVYSIDLAQGARSRVFVLTSERLGFSFWNDNDLPSATALWGDPRVTALLDARGQLTTEQVRERLEMEIRTHDAEQIQYWPLFLLETGEFAGCCGLRPYRPAEKICELGVHLRPAMWGMRLATEACRAVIEHAFQVLGVRGLYAGHHPGNITSRRLLLRLGFRYTHDDLYAPTGLRHPSYMLMADGSTAPPRS